MADTPSFNRKDLRSPDAFFEAAGRLNRYLGQNRRPVIVAALTAAVRMSFFVALAAAILFPKLA